MLLYICLMLYIMFSCVLKLFGVDINDDTPPISNKKPRDDNEGYHGVDWNNNGKIDWWEG